MKYFTYKLDLIILNVFAVISFVFMIFLTYFITGNLDFLLRLNFYSLILVFIFLFLHEILHGIGFYIFGRVNFNKIVFGMELEKGIFYCMCKDIVGKIGSLVAIILPFIIFGIVPYILGFFYSSNLLIFLGIFNLCGSVGDIIMFLDMLFMPRDIKYLDLDDNTCFTILSRKDLSKEKYFSIILKDKGKYNDNIRAKDFEKFKISKGSWWFLIIFFIMLVILFLLDRFLT